jgi:DNA-binding MarR family transcriptional regulator
MTPNRQFIRCGVAGGIKVSTVIDMAMQRPQASKDRGKPMLKDEDFRTLAAVRAAIRGFAHFTEKVVQTAGLTPQQHQVLVALRAADGGELSVGELAQTLMLRLEALGLVDRMRSKADGRVVVLRLTNKAMKLMSSLSHTHREELRRIRPLLISLLSQLD